MDHAEDDGRVAMQAREQALLDVYHRTGGGPAAGE
jgi:hypothetical protein